MGRIDTASQLCTLVFDGNLPLLKRYLQAGIEVRPTSRSLHKQVKSNTALNELVGCIDCRAVAHCRIMLLSGRNLAIGTDCKQGRTWTVDSCVSMHRWTQQITTNAPPCTSQPARPTSRRYA